MRRIGYLIMVAATALALLWPRAARANDASDAAVAAGMATVLFLGCDHAFDNKWGCAFGSAVLTTILMYANVHTADSRSTINRKLENHAAGASVVIPLGLLSK